ncbi:MAG: response regulator [Candidatus Electrothrix scaldis]|nr:MAG: response regulator [Candidatus Electrothrix sp. GW3-3]
MARIDEWKRLTRQTSNLTKKLLIVDDSPGELQLFQKVLSNEGYIIITAQDGEEGIAKALAEQPDLIILDIIMPKKTGFQACRAIKSRPETQHTPVILLSSKNHQADKYWGMKQGADLYLTKPVVPSELLKAVAGFIARHLLMRYEREERRRLRKNAMKISSQLVQL